MKTYAMIPFSNETDCIQLSGLTIENREDCVSIYGTLDFTADKRGLASAMHLQSIVNQVVSHLESITLPERVETIETTQTANPFI